MATERKEYPYSQFNFIVEIEGIVAGFQEVSGLGMEINVTEYRNGTSKDNAPIKVTSTYKVPDVTLKRGLIGTVDFKDWLNLVRNKGGNTEKARRNASITLKNEDQKVAAMKWNLKNVRPIKYTAPSLNAKGTDVAIEELVLSCERIEIE